MNSNIKNNLMKEYKYKIEMHAHTTPVSRCSQISPEEMAKTYSSLGYDAVVITNHFIHGSFGGRSLEDAINFYLSGYEETKACAKKYGLHVILGAEIRFTEHFNDYLVYGVDNALLTSFYDMLPKGLENFRKEAALERSVLVHAHPFRDGMKEVKPELLDGVEVFNMHPGHNSRIGFAAKYAKKNDFSIITSGSDFHHPNLGHEGVSALRTKVLPEDSFELAEILKSGDYILEIADGILILP